MTTTTRRRLRKLAATLPLAALAGLAGALAASAPASAAGVSYIGSNSGGANVRACSNTACTSYGWLSNGTRVQMECWEDTQWVYPPSSDYPSNRWFRINSPRWGYVHSSLVENQTSVPHC